MKENFVTLFELFCIDKLRQTDECCWRDKSWLCAPTRVGTKHHSSDTILSVLFPNSSSITTRQKTVSLTNSSFTDNRKCAHCSSKTDFPDVVRFCLCGFYYKRRAHNVVFNSRLATMCNHIVSKHFKKSWFSSNIIPHLSRGRSMMLSVNDLQKLEGTIVYWSLT